MASNNRVQGYRAQASRPAWHSSFLVRLAACTVLATTFAAAAPGTMAAELRVTGRLALSLGSGDWILGIRTDTDGWVQRREDEIGSPPRPAMDVTARFSGPGARFQSLRLNGLPVALRDPVLHAGGSEEPATGIRWEYVALGVAGAGALVLIVREALVDDFADNLGDAISGEGGN